MSKEEKLVKELTKISKEGRSEDLYINACLAFMRYIDNKKVTSAMNQIVSASGLKFLEDNNE